MYIYVYNFQHTILKSYVVYENIYKNIKYYYTCVSNVQFPLDFVSLLLNPYLFILHIHLCKNP